MRPPHSAESCGLCHPTLPQNQRPGARMAAGGRCLFRFAQAVGALAGRRAVRLAWRACSDQAVATPASLAERSAWYDERTNGPEATWLKPSS